MEAGRHNELLSFVTAIILFITVCIVIVQINVFLPDYLSVILFFLSPVLLVFNIYIVYRLTKILNSKYSPMAIIAANMAIISLVIAHLWMEKNVYPRGNESSMSLCGRSNIYNVYSPNKTKKAIVYHYSCGATTGITTVVTLANANDTLEDTPSAADVFRAEGDAIDRIVWMNENHLRIDHNPSQKVFHSSNEFNGIRIDFRSVSGFPPSRE